MNHEIRVLGELGSEFERVVLRAEPRRRRLVRRWRPLALIAGLVLGGTTGALAAAGVFERGTPLEAGAPVIPTQSNGAAIPGSARLTLRVPDPRGGLPWAVRVLRTTRDETCIQVGRFAFGTIGVLGQDGAFANDGRFHPISENYENPLSCSNSDAHDHAFINNVLQNVPASGYEQGCRLAAAARPFPAAFLRQHPVFARGVAQSRAIQRRTPVCPERDVREVYYGLLGPDAASVTYTTPAGSLATTATAGPDGAYLIVLPGKSAAPLCGADIACPLDTIGVGGGLWADGVIRAIHYRDGHSCSRNLKLTLEQPPCPNVGYLAPTVHLPTASEVASPITVRRDPPRYGEHQITVSFISHVAIHNSRDYYYFDIAHPATSAANPPVPHNVVCTAQDSQDFTTYSNYARGQRVTDTEFLPRCHGTFHGTITLILNGDYVAHIPGGAGATTIPVGNFNIKEP